jgi:hypothetical protein
MLNTSSEFDFLIGPGSKFHSAGAGALLGHLDEAIGPDGNLILLPGDPNPLRNFEFTMPDGSTQVVVATDPGRALITGDFFNDGFNFRIPTLWGIKNTAPYFHDNSAKTLKELLDHYNRLFEFINDQIPNDVFVLMTEQDEADIIAFLNLL